MFCISIYLFTFLHLFPRIFCHVHIQNKPNQPNTLDRFGYIVKVKDINILKRYLTIS
jgi:uncharacterized membrane protein YagU involved in acid resistance